MAGIAINGASGAAGLAAGWAGPTVMALTDEPAGTNARVPRSAFDLSVSTTIGCAVAVVVLTEPSPARTP